MKKLASTSYELEHCLHDGRTTKKHASHLSPFPLPLIPFVPVDGPDTGFGQINKPIGKELYVQAGIEGFAPLWSFVPPSSSHYAYGQYLTPFHWPLLSELND
jgi:hypothetical protein